MAGPDRDSTDGGMSAKPSLWERLSSAMLKPAPTADESGTASEGPTTVPEIEAAIKRADDKERLIGLLAAPLAGAIALLVVGNLEAHDPKALLANGQLNKLHVNPSLYAELGAVTLVLAVLILAMAWFRKRTFLGIAMALYGLSIFNLRYWGFGLPFIIVGAWYLVRSYRLSEKLKAAKADGSPGSAPGSTARPPAPSKRYTPPSAPSRRVPKPKPDKGLEAG